MPLPLKAVLRPPSCGKHWRFEAINLNEDQQFLVRVGMQEPEIRKLHPFLQGEDARNGWMMVEFWSDNIETIREKSKHFFDLLKLPFWECGPAEQPFTRADLGYS